MFNLLVSGLVGKRIGLNGHPIAVVKVAIASIIHDNDNNNDNIMQRVFLNMVGGACKYLTDFNSRRYAQPLQYRKDRIYDNDLIRFQTSIRCCMKERIKKWEEMWEMGKLYEIMGLLFGKGG